MAPSERPNTTREFRCDHCNGKILIPHDLPPTTGPCPHCGGEITSPAIDPTPALPQFYREPSTPLTGPVPAPALPPTPEPPASPAPALAPIPTDAPQAPPKEPAIPREETADPTPRKPGQKTNKKKSGKPSATGVFAVLLVLLLIAAGICTTGYFAYQQINTPTGAQVITAPPKDSPASEANYIRIGWQKDAYELLRNFIAADSSAGKLPYILNPEGLAPRLEDFYGGGTIIDSDTPADAFIVYDLPEADRKRGLFMMIYDQPPWFEMKEFFRPLASLEVQYGVADPDLLLSTFSRRENFELEPLRVHAFFKRTKDGLKLDWETFAQTKYRTFQNFVELPEPGQSGVFRVWIMEDVPDNGRAVSGMRTYRLSDTANKTDSTRINVNVDSEVGRALSIINWRGNKDAHPIIRTATVELKWTGETDAPELQIQRFICWEFLGLGGQESPAAASKN